MEGQGQQSSNATLPPGETQDRNLIDFMTKKDEKNQEDAAMTDLHAEGMCDPTEREKQTLLGKLHDTHSHSDSSSSSDEEEEEGGESKKTKKKGLKNKMKENLSGEKEESKKQPESAAENCIEMENAEEKKGFLDKIKEKLPGHHKKTEGDVSVPCTDEGSPVGETKEKKGIMEKIIEKLPGHHKNEGEPKNKN